MAVAAARDPGLACGRRYGRPEVPLARRAKLRDLRRPKPSAALAHRLGARPEPRIRRGLLEPPHQGTAGGAAFGRPIRLELGLPRAGLFTALLSFNTEVELGQAAIVALAAKVLVWLRGSRTFATAGLATGSAAIGAELVLLVSATR